MAFHAMMATRCGPNAQYLSAVFMIAMRRAPRRASWKVPIRSCIIPMVVRQSRSASTQCQRSHRIRVIRVTWIRRWAWSSPITYIYVGGCLRVEIGVGIEVHLIRLALPIHLHADGSQPVPGFEAELGGQPQNLLLVVLASLRRRTWDGLVRTGVA